ncbi:MAG: SAM-dependent methyltransferase [Labilithrix sp.]|nr:SAM-dependent methyltransferase [Labilithrix sp.]
MQEGRASFTAAYVATCRSLGGALPREARLVDDPWGARFAGPLVAGAVEVATKRRDGRLAPAIAGRVPFVLYMQVRTRVLDDAVARFAAEGGRQIVLLGAGFDARAARFPALSFFEIDHPDTQRRKRRLFSSSPKTTYVAWNFERDDLAALPRALVDHGHARGEPTLTIWEGVTMYLTEAAADASVVAVASYSAPRSVLAMTYFDRVRLVDPSPIHRLARAIVGAVGEPFRFGWDPPALPAWLDARGFDVERDDDLADLAGRLLPPSFARRVDRGTTRVALARRG